ncbi:MAG: hypothetical protein U9N59_15045, partial [Campylobacterota bacterium]|nr:hypothetical protein [Campylobacterota bacterium]
MFKSLVRIVFIVGFIWQGLVANGLNKYSDYPDWVFNIPQDKNKVYAIGSIQTKINSDDAIVRNKIYKKFQHGSVYSVFKDNKTVSKKELKEIAYYRAYLELMKSYNLSITYKGRYYKVNNKLGMTKNTTQLTKLYDIKTKKEKEFLSKDGNYFILLSTKIVYAKSNSKDVAKILTKSENGKFFYKQLFNTQEYGSNTKFTIKNNTQHGSQLPMYFSKYMMRSDYKIGTVDLMESQNFYIKYEQAILEARIQFIQNQTQKLNYTNIVHTYIDKNGVMHVVIKLNEDMKHRIEEQKREQKKKEEELKKERKKFKLKPFLQTGHSNTVIKMYISKDDKYMISKERDGIWILWDFELRKKIKEDKSLYELEKYFKKGYFISNKYIQNASIMDKYENFDKNIKHQIIIESKQYIISGGSDNIINIWDTNTKKLKHSFKAHKLGIHSFAISNDNKYLVSSSYKTIKKWDIKTGEFLGKFGVSIANPRLSRFTKYKRNYTDWNSLDNKNTIQSNKFISYNFDLDKYYIWNLDNFSVEKINDIEDYNNIDYAGNSIDIKKEKDVKYSTIKAEGKTISTFKSYKTGGYDDTKYFTGHEGNVNYLLYWKKKNMFFSSSEKGVIKLWDIKSQKKILTMAVFNDDEWVVMTPQGYFNASKNGAKHISIKTDLVKVASIDAFYKKFYRPDLVKLALQGVEIKLDESFSDIIKNKPAPKLS